MATRKFRFKHIAQDASEHVGDAGDLILDTTLKTLKVSDGSTAGGTDVKTGLSLDVAENDGSSVTLDLSKQIHFLNGSETDGNDKTYIVPNGTTVGQILYLCKGQHDGGDGTVAHKDSAKVTFSKTVGISGQTTVQTNLTREIFGQYVHLVTCIWRGDAWIISRQVT